jgi:hypothetical protein
MAPRIDYPTVAPEVHKALTPRCRHGVRQDVNRFGLSTNLTNKRLCLLRRFARTRLALSRRTPGARLDSVAAWHASSYFTDREKAALTWGESLTHVAATDAPDEVHEIVRRHFSEIETANLTDAIALMNAFNRVAFGCGANRGEAVIVRRSCSHQRNAGDVIAKRLALGDCRIPTLEIGKFRPFGHEFHVAVDHDADRDIAI